VYNNALLYACLLCNEENIATLNEQEIGDWVHH